MVRATANVWLWYNNKLKVLILSQATLTMTENILGKLTV